MMRELANHVHQLRKLAPLIEDQRLRMVVGDAIGCLCLITTFVGVLFIGWGLS